ncbi:MAG: hypothetical protein ABIS47_05200 [Acidimicrobiales bacterium]
MVKGPAGIDVLTVELAADGSGRVRGDLGGAVDLSAGALRGGTRRWQSQGQPLGDVKLEASSKLKLKGPDGATRWVAKLSGAPRRRRCWRARTWSATRCRPRSGAGEAKIKEGDAEIGSVKGRGSGGAKVEWPDGNTVFQTDLPPAPSLGLLLAARIPAPPKAVLLVELVDRARP